jgi:hypothetical protein
MKHLIFTLFLLAYSCHQEPMRMQILNQQLGITDTISAKFTNNTRDDYLVYFYDIKPSYIGDGISSLRLNITHSNELIEVNIIDGDIFFFSDDEDRQIPIPFLTIIPAKSSKIIKFPLIDSSTIDRPVLKKGIEYDVVLQTELDTAKIGWKEMKADIRSLQKKYKVKIFQGKLKSNQVKLKY